jgi:hypothetical protein
MEGRRNERNEEWRFGHKERRREGEINRWRKERKRDGVVER